MGRREARARRRSPPGRLPGRRLARQLLRRRALPRQLRRAGRRLRRHARPARRARAEGRDDPERRRQRTPAAAVDRVRRPLGRAAGGVLQRPDRAQSEAIVGGADRRVRGLARPGLRGPDGRHLRDGRHGRLLLGRGTGVAGAGAAASKPDGDAAPPRRRAGARPLRDQANELEAERAAPGRPPPRVGADRLGCGAHVRLARAAIPRNRPAADPRLAVDRGPPGARLRRVRPGRRRCLRRGCRRACGHHGRDRDEPDPARDLPRPGRDGLRPRSDRRECIDRPGRCLQGGVQADAAAARRDRDRRWRPGSRSAPPCS